MTAVRPFVSRAVQRRASGLGLGVRVVAQAQQQFHRLDVGFLRPLVRDAFHPADAGRDLQRGDVDVRGDVRIGAVFEQQLHHGEIARLGRAPEGGRAVLMYPLRREHRPEPRRLLDSRS